MTRTVLAALMIALALPSHGQEGTPALEFRLAAAQPCEGIPHVGLLDRLRLDRVEVLAEGNRVAATITGAIRCRGEGGSAVPLHATADFTVTATARLNACGTTTAEAEITAIDAASAVMDPFEAQVGMALGAAARGWAESVCTALLQGP